MMRVPVLILRLLTRRRVSPRLAPRLEETRLPDTWYQAEANARGVLGVAGELRLEEMAGPDFPLDEVNDAFEALATLEV